MGRRVSAKILTPLQFHTLKNEDIITKLFEDAAGGVAAFLGLSTRRQAPRAVSAPPSTIMPSALEFEIFVAAATLGDLQLSY